MLLLMAIKSTIYKANIQLSNIDKNHYDNLQLTLARHSSETEERLMIRLLAFLQHADTQPSFGKGISNEDEAVVWSKNDVDEIMLWIELGQIDLKRIKRASRLSKQMVIYCYGSTADIWWPQIKEKLSDFKNLTVFKVPNDTSEILAQFANRNMSFDCMIEDGQLWLHGENQSNLITVEQLL